MYEIRLKREFELLQMLQNSEVRNYIRIYYRERSGRDNQWKPVTTNQSEKLYPNRFKVTYRFPKMYVGPGRYVSNWEKSFYCTVDEQTLMSPSRPFILEIDGGRFKDEELPFCPHACVTNLCTGSASSVAKSFGLFYFFCLVGAILNMDKCIVDTEGVHYNPQAHQWWREERRFRPTNNIKWPFDLNQRLSRQHHSNDSATPTIRFGKTIPAQTPKIVFGKKY